jgi:TRAF-type zinc finger
VLDREDTAAEFTVVREGSSSTVISVAKEPIKRTLRKRNNSLETWSEPLPRFIAGPSGEPQLQQQPSYSVAYPSGSKPLLSTERAASSPDATAAEIAEAAEISPAETAQCTHCCKEVPAHQLQAHVRSSCRLMPCSSCGVLLLPRAQHEHDSTACKNRRVPCTLCAEVLPLSQHPRHTRDACPRRPVLCACSEHVAADTTESHLADSCKLRAVQCPHACSDTIVGLTAETLQQHLLVCTAQPQWQCGCGVLIAREQRAAHLADSEPFRATVDAACERLLRSCAKAVVCRAVARVARSAHVTAAIAYAALAMCSGDAAVAETQLQGSAVFNSEMHLIAEVANVAKYIKALSRSTQQLKHGWLRGDAAVLNSKLQAAAAVDHSDDDREWAQQSAVLSLTATGK